MNVTVPVLGEMSDDGLAWPVRTEPGVLVIECVPPVAHQVRPTVQFYHVDTVLTGSQQPVQLQVAGVVIADRVLVQQARLPDDVELGQVPPEARVSRRVEAVVFFYSQSPAGRLVRQVEY